MLEILTTNAEQSVNADEALLDDEQLKQYFGELFASNPSKFRFLPGDRKFIQLVKDLIQRDIQKKGRKRALNRFGDKSKHPQKKNRKSSKNTAGENCSFSEGDCKEESADSLNSVHMLKTMLYTYVQEKLSKLGIPSSVLSVFVKSFVSAVKNDDGTICGDVICVVCYAQSDTPEKVKPKSVFCRTKAGKQTWVISNLIKHIKNAHKDILCLSVVDDVLQTECTDVNQQVSQENISVQYFPDDSVGAICMDEVDANTIEKHFNYQISKQAIKMWEAATINCENVEQVECVFQDGSVAFIEVVKIHQDGNCLFSSISHQLFGTKVGSAEHIQSSNNIRAEVVKHIDENYEDFSYELHGHVYELKENGLVELYGLEEIDDIDKASKEFLANGLTQSGCWGGGETLKAITHIYNVNIFIFNEKGHVYLVSNTQRRCDRSIALAYRLPDNGNGLRNHYNSMCNITADLIYKTAKLVTDNLDLNRNLQSTSIIDLNST